MLKGVIMSYLNLLHPILPVHKPFARPVIQPSRIYPYQCLSLNGSGYASRASEDALNINEGDFVVGAWIRTCYVADRQNIVDKYGGGAGAGFNIYLSATNGRLGATIRDTGDIVASTDDGANLCNGQWHHALIGFKRSSNMLRIVDGGTYGTADDISARNLTIDDSTRLTVGANRNSVSTFYGLLANLEVFYFGYGGLDLTEMVTYAAARSADPYGSLAEVMPSWEGYANANRGEVLNNGSDFAANWVTTNDWDITGGNAHYTYSSQQTNDLVQSSANRAKLGNNSCYYELTYTVAITTPLVGATPVLRGSRFSDSPVPLDITNGTHKVVFLSGSTASSTDFSIRLGSTVTAGDFTLDDISVKRVGLVGDWRLGGDYTDEMSNSLDLTAGGSGNKFRPLGLDFNLG